MGSISGHRIDYNKPAGNTQQKLTQVTAPSPFPGVGYTPRSYLFSSATVRIPVHSTPKCGKEHIPYVTLHFPDRRGVASAPLPKRGHNFFQLNPMCILMPCIRSNRGQETEFSVPTRSK